MIRNTRTVKPGQSLVPQPIRLDDYLMRDDSFPSAYTRALGALAASDGSVTLAEFAAITEIARQSDNPALAGVMALHAIEHPISWSEATRVLRRSAAELDVSGRQAAFDAAMPLLRQQGASGRTLARDLAKALSLTPTPHELVDFEPEAQRNVWHAITRRTRQIIKGTTIDEDVAELVRTTGDQDIGALLSAFEEGTIDANAVREGLRETSAAIGREISAYRERIALAEKVEQTAAHFIETSRELSHQVTQRLAAIESRIQFERDTFAEDMDEAVHDAGNAIELLIADRMKTDKWTLAQVWESVGRNQFGKELERRIDRIVRRREEMLGLLKNDLRLFQNDMRYRRASLLDRQHHTALARMMPPLRIGTRIVNTLDSAAEVTLGAGTLGAIGAGTAAYYLGVAAVWPVIAPVAPIVGGAVAVAGLFKWMTDSDKRKDAEITNKREAFEKVLRKQLNEAQASFNQQLDAVSDEFRLSAEQLLRPVLLEAEAAERLNGMQAEFSRRLVAHSDNAIKRLSAKLNE